VLRWLPSNQTKRFPKLGVVQAAQLAKEEGLPAPAGHRHQHPVGPDALPDVGGLRRI
jgi:hypothetical protein